MSFSMSRASLPSLETTLNALSNVLEKGEAFAAAKNIDPSVLLQTRLAPDMFPMIRQVMIATDITKNGMARLANVEPPRFEDKETTIAELKERIAKTIAFLKTLDTAKIDASIDREIVFPVGREKKAKMKGGDYLSQYIVPNAYFHCVAAYLILRHCGVEVGKMDYLGAMPIELI